MQSIIILHGIEKQYILKGVIMQQHIFIKDLPPHGTIRGVYLLSAASLQNAKNGPYWNITLNDASGDMNGKIWAPLSADFSDFPTGSFVHISGRTSLYREQTQVNIDALSILSPAEQVELDMTLYVATSPFDIEDMWQELKELCHKEFTHPAWKDFIFRILSANEIRLAWMACPAAKNIHHAYRGGLLEHSLSVAKLALSIADHYPHLDRQVLLAGAIFHDLGKIWEYSYGLITDYTDSGRLLGHMQLVLDYLNPILQECDLEEEYVMHFKHLILSHHGTYEFGSSRLPQTPEAMLLHYADNIDAKMAQCKQIFAEKTDDFIGWSSYQRSLERHMYQPLRHISLPIKTENEQEFEQVQEQEVEQIQEYEQFQDDEQMQSYEQLQEYEQMQSYEQLQEYEQMQAQEHMEEQNAQEHMNQDTKPCESKKAELKEKPRQQAMQLGLFPDFFKKA